MEIWAFRPAHAPMGNTRPKPSTGSCSCSFQSGLGVDEVAGGPLVHETLAGHHHEGVAVCGVRHGCFSGLNVRRQDRLRDVGPSKHLPFFHGDARLGRRHFHPSLRHQHGLLDVVGPGAVQLCAAESVVHHDRIHPWKVQCALSKGRARRKPSASNQGQTPHPNSCRHPSLKLRLGLVFLKPCAS